MSKFFSAGDSVLTVTGVDFSQHVGKTVKITAGVPALNDSATAPAKALVVEGNVAAKNSTLLILGGAVDAQFVRIAADSADLKQGDLLMQKNDGTFTKDTGLGNRCIAGIVTNPNGAVAGDLVSATVFKPIFTLGSQVAAITQTSNATIAGTHSTAVNPTKADFDALLVEAGKLQADFYTLQAALVALGIITNA